ncbi:gliding motility-associated C-terminal domain-containing protein [Adhaeribacter swui]|uniref:Gliding motility-associated C-terminal domain-containing protein n=1 Tax=Adhaeribacter swui TaxID=2086471 RepID=A0A7G7GAH3_9BACT|nr:gliding motility-associated C-terminal domain-containing protein [Adhaeribacter swui]QNF34157.1 gliding motility-associated C-terminal domain-containing protein [Adhaeribacter swui]
MQQPIRYLYLFLVFVLFSVSSYAQCPANITPSGTAYICNGSPVLLTANEGLVNPDLRYQWFRNGTLIPGATNQTFNATTVGTYAVEVNSRSTPPACPSNTTNPGTTVEIGPNLVRPDFTFSPTGVQCSGDAITFQIVGPNNSDYEYLWDFGDGTVGRGYQVEHAFTYFGTNTKTFNVSVVTAFQGCRSQTSAPQTITIEGGPNFTPTMVTDSANFEVCIPKDSSISVRAKLFNNITADAASAAGITGYLVRWTPDGDPINYDPTLFNPDAFIRNDIPFDTIGTYPISITAVGPTCNTTITLLYQVSQDPTAGFSVSPPDGKKRLDPNQCVPVIVTPVDSARGGNLTYKWSVLNNQGQPAGGVTYINNTTDTSVSPVFQFNMMGRFQIQQIVTNQCGSDTTSQSVLIAYPEVQLNADGPFCGPTTVKFSDQNVFYDTNLGTEVPGSFRWVITGTSGATFVNGTSANSKYPEIRFPNVGEYKVSVSFANECGNSADVAQQGAGEVTITVNEIPRAPVIAVTGVAICSDESTTITPTGPAGNTFLFYTGATGGTPIDTTTSFNTGPLTASTTFYVTTLSPNGCESVGARTPFAVTVFPAIANNTITQDQEVCQGSAPALLSGTQPTGGDNSTGYRYTWQFSQEGPNGTYNIAPGVNNGRDYTPPVLQANTWFRRLVASASCANDTSNVIAITVTPRVAGGTITGEQQVCANEPVLPLTGSPLTSGTIQWRSSTVSATAGFTPATNINNEENYEPGILSQTTWFRRYVISGGCIDSSNVVQVTVTQPVTNNTILNDQSLCGGTRPAPLTGSTPQGGTQPLRFIWESSTSGPNDGFAPAAGTNNTANYNPAAITVTTWFRRGVLSGGCDPNYSNTVQISVFPGITANTISGPETAVCENTVPQTINGSAPSGGNGTYTYLWESSITSATAAFAPAAGTNNTQNYTPPVLNRTTWFRRTVISDNCSSVSEVVRIDVNKLPTAPIVEAASVSTCLDSTATLVATGPGGTYQWFETATGGNILFEGATFVTSPLRQTTTFYVQAVNQNQCVSPTRTAVTVNVSSFTVDAGRDTTIIEGNTMELVARGGVRWQWEPAAGLNDPTVQRPVARPTKTTTYKVTAYSEEGCAATDEVTITVIPRVIIVNTFSPNRDGINETWEIQRIENYPQATVEIFNRYGTKVFTSAPGYPKPWDGTYNGKDLPLATYYYIIRLDNNSKPISGNVTLIR